MVDNKKTRSENIQIKIKKRNKDVEKQEKIEKINSSRSNNELK